MCMNGYAVGYNIYRNCLLRRKIFSRSITSSMRTLVSRRISASSVVKDDIIPVGVFTSRVALSLSRWVESAAAVRFPCGQSYSYREYPSFLPSFLLSPDISSWCFPRVKSFHKDGSVWKLMKLLNCRSSTVKGS